VTRNGRAGRRAVGARRTERGLPEVTGQRSGRDTRRPVAAVSRGDATEPSVSGDVSPGELAEQTATTGAEEGTHTLFGRGMLYVVVWSIPVVSAAVVSPVLAHLLPPSQFGQLASGIALHQVMIVLAVVGLDQVLILARAEARSDTPARSYLAIGLALACAITCMAVGSAPWWSRELGFPGLAGIVLVTLAWTVPAAGLQLVTVLLMSQDRLRAFACLVVVSGVGAHTVGLGMVLGTGSRTASTYALGYLTAMTAVLVAGLVLVKPRWHGLLDVHLVRRGLALGLPLSIGALAAHVLTAGDRLVIQRLLGSAETGRYQIAYIIGYLGATVLHLTTGAWAPRIAAVRDEAQRWALLATARERLIKLMNPTILGLTLAAPLALTIVAPPSYRPEHLLPVVFLVALAGFPLVFCSVFERALITLRRGRALAGSAIVAATVNIGLNLVLVPSWGITGAAAATVFAFALQAFVQRLALPRGVTLPRPRLTVVMAALVAVVLSATTLLLPQTPTWNLGRFLLAAACLPWLFVELQRARSNGAVDRGTRRMPP